MAVLPAPTPPMLPPNWLNSEWSPLTTAADCRLWLRVLVVMIFCECTTCELTCCCCCVETVESSAALLVPSNELLPLFTVDELLAIEKERLAIFVSIWLKIRCRVVVDGSPTVAASPHSKSCSERTSSASTSLGVVTMYCGGETLPSCDIFGVCLDWCVDELALWRLVMLGSACGFRFLRTLATGDL